MTPPCWQLIWCWRRRRRWQWWWRFCPVKAGGWMITGGSRWVIILHSLTEYSIHTLLTVYSMHILHSVYSIHRHTRHYSLCILHTHTHSLCTVHTHYTVQLYCTHSTNALCLGHIALPCCCSIALSSTFEHFQTHWSTLKHLYSKCVQVLGSTLKHSKALWSTFEDIGSMQHTQSNMEMNAVQFTLILRRGT